MPFIETISPYNFAYFVLNDERKRLYDRIDKRVDIMVENGLVEEVKKLKNMGYTSALITRFTLFSCIVSYETGSIFLSISWSA